MSAGTHTAMAAAAMARLSDAGMGEHAMPGWWRTPREELGGLAPEDALSRDQRRVVELAEEDADRFRADLNDNGGAE